MDGEHYDAANEAFNRLFSKLADAIENNTESVGICAWPVQWLLRGTWDCQHGMPLSSMIALSDKSFKDVIIILRHMRDIPYNYKCQSICSMVPGGRVEIEALLEKAGFH